MKTIHPTLNPTDDAEFSIEADGEAPFVIRGDYATLAPLYEQIGHDIKQEAKRAPRAPKQPSAAMIAVQRRRHALKLSFAARWYDLLNGTRFYAELQRKRQMEKDLRMASYLGLFQEEVCAKHRKALATVAKVAN